MALGLDWDVGFFWGEVKASAMEDYERALQEEQKNLQDLLDPSRIDKLCSLDDVHKDPLCLWDDDDLLGELKDFGYESDEDLTEQNLIAEIQAEERQENDLEHQKPTGNETAVGHKDDYEIGQLEAEVKDAEREAVRLKRENRKEDAIGMMRKVKVLRQKLEDAKNRTQPDAQEVHQVNQAIAAAVQARLETVKGIQNEAIQRKQATISEVLKTRLLQYQSEALRLKRAGQIAEAKKCMLVIRRIRELKATSDQGGEVSHSDVPVAPSDPGSDDNDIQDSQPAVASTGLNQAATKEYDTLQWKLESEVAHFTRQARAFYKDGSGSQGDKIVALEYNRVRKNLLQSLNKLKEAREKLWPPPVCVAQSKTVSREICHEDVPENVLQVKIVRCTNLNNPSLKPNDTSSFVTWAFQVGENVQKGQSGVISRNSNPEYHHIIQLGIERNKSASRRWKYLKLNLEVWHHRAMWRDTLLGQCTFKLAPLLEKADFRQTAKVKLDLHTAGMLECEFRMRHPIQGRDIRQITETFHTLEFRQSASSLPANAATALLPSAPNSPPPELSPLEIADPHNPILYRSNDVLEEEISSMQREIDLLGSQGDEKVREDLLERKSSLDIQLQILVTRVQTGKININGYLDDLKKTINHDLKLATWLGKVDRKDDAVRVLKRVKIMKAEVLNAEANMEQLD